MNESRIRGTAGQIKRKKKEIENAERIVLRL